jgi:hypothetical protein
LAASCQGSATANPLNEKMIAQIDTIKNSHCLPEINITHLLVSFFSAEFKWNQFLFQREKNLEVETRLNNEEEQQIRIYRCNCELEIKLQMSTIF